VYTISSDLGLDAALQHKTVVTVGRPDYAGHGFTLDRQPVVAGTNLSAVQYVEELAQKTCWIDVLYKRVLIW
jgi:capsule polysaccharide export protein KpsC/LpsZ